MSDAECSVWSKGTGGDSNGGRKKQKGRKQRGAEKLLDFAGSHGQDIGMALGWEV